MGANVVLYGTGDSPSPLAEGRSHGTEVVTHEEGTGDGNRTVCRHAAWFRINGAEEMWQEKTKQKVCHMTCNNKYHVVQPHPMSPCG